MYEVRSDISESAEESGWRALSPLTPLSLGSVAFLGPCASGFPDVFVTSCWCCCRSQEGLQGSCDHCWVCPVSAPSVCFPSLCGDWGLIQMAGWLSVPLDVRFSFGLGRKNGRKNEQGFFHQ